MLAADRASCQALQCLSTEANPAHYHWLPGSGLEMSAGQDSHTSLHNHDQSNLLGQHKSIQHLIIILRKLCDNASRSYTSQEALL